MTDVEFPTHTNSLQRAHLTSTTMTLLNFQFGPTRHGIRQAEFGHHQRIAMSTVVIMFSMNSRNVIKILVKWNLFQIHFHFCYFKGVNWYHTQRHIHYLLCNVQMLTHNPSKKFLPNLFSRKFHLNYMFLHFVIFASVHSKFKVSPLKTSIKCSWREMWAMKNNPRRSRKKLQKKWNGKWSVTIECVRSNGCLNFYWVFLLLGIYFVIIMCVCVRARLQLQQQRTHTVHIYQMVMTLLTLSSHACMLARLMNRSLARTHSTAYTSNSFERKVKWKEICTHYKLS